MARPRKPRVTPAQDKLTALGIDAYCEMVQAGETLKSISEKFSVAEGTIINWLAADGERSARAKVAREQSAFSCADKARTVLEDVKADATPAEMMRARELAQHYRWESKVRNNKSFGDRQILEGGDVPLTVEIVRFGK